MYLSTKRLPHYLGLLEQTEALLPTITRKSIYHRQSDLIVKAMVFRFHQFSDYWIHDEDSWCRFMEPAPEAYKVIIPLPIERSFCVLEETLDAATRLSYGLDHRRAIDPWHQCKGMIEDLRRDNWCPSEISLVLMGFGDTTTFFTSQLDRKRTKADHSRCSSTKCIAFNINSKEYRTQHASDCRGCADVSINRTNLANTLHLDKTPRLRIKVPNVDKEQRPELSIEDTGPYVAISHVWSDGIGNAASNALPSCQLLRLRDFIKQLDKGETDAQMAVWIDTLLVPTEKGVEKRLALSRLFNYYREADMVLVLDSDLLQASRFCSKEEQMARVFFSTWMRRLWTLEEGILSRDRLVFQFRDGIVSMKHLLDIADIAPRLDNIGNNVNQLLSLFLPDMAQEYSCQPDDHQARSAVILKILTILEYRLTTKAADEPLCLSHILGLDAATIVGIDEADARMREFYKMLTEYGALFPKRLLFTNEPKLPMHGVSWAPVSFMAFDSEDVNYIRLQPSGESCEYSLDRGLLVDNLDGFVLDFSEETFKKITFVKVDTRIYALIPTRTNEKCQDHDRFWSREEHEKALSVNPMKDWTNACREMIGQIPKSLAVVHTKTEVAILVSVYRSERQSDEEGDILLYARPITHCYMYELKVKDYNYIALGATSDVIRSTTGWDLVEVEAQMHAVLDEFHDSATSTFLECKSIDSCQQWCIG